MRSMYTGALIAATMALTAPAVACDDHDHIALHSNSASGSQAVVKVQAVAQDDSRSFYRNFMRDDDNTVEITVDNGDIKVRLNGKEVPADRIENHDGQLTIYDEDGNEIKSFSVFVTPGGDVVGGFGNRFRFAEQFAPKWEGEQPKVMIGIQMGEPGPALRKHLRLKEGESTLINGIYEGLPAEKAGIELYDVIVAIDGRKPAAPADIREVAAALEPGDQVTLTVIHAGRTREFSVTLEAFDGERLGPANLAGGGQLWRGETIFVPDGKGMIEVPGPGNQWFGRIEGMEQFDWEKFAEQLRDQLGPQFEQFERQFRNNQKEADVDDQLERLQRRLEQLQETLDDLIDQSEEN